MDGNYRARARGNQALDFGFVDIQSVFADIAENGFRPAQNECVDARDKRVGRHDYLVALAYVAENRRHIKRRRARVCQQRRLCARKLRDFLLADFHKFSVALKMARRDCLLDVGNFRTFQRYSVKRDIHFYASIAQSARQFKAKIFPRGAQAARRIAGVYSCKTARRAYICAKFV